MAHRITFKEASEKLEKEKETQELARHGNYTSSRKDKKRLQRIKKEQGWLEYIRARGGLAKSEEEKEKDKNG